MYVYIYTLTHTHKHTQTHTHIHTYTHTHTCISIYLSVCLSVYSLSRAITLSLSCFTHLYYAIQMTCTYKPVSLVLIQGTLAAVLHSGRQQKRPEFPKHHGPILQRIIDSTQPGQSRRIESQLENTKVSRTMSRLKG